MGGGDPNLFLDISSRWVERSLHAEFQLPRKLPPAISLLFRTGGGRAAGGQRAGGWLEELKLRLTQPSLAGSGAELGNYQVTECCCARGEYIFIANIRAYSKGNNWFCKSDIHP